MPCWSTVEPGIPLMASLVLEIRPTILLRVSPAIPHLEYCQRCVWGREGATYQFAFILISSVGCARIAGVHSLYERQSSSTGSGLLYTYTMWILAIRAQLIRRALSKILSLGLVSINPSKRPHRMLPSPIRMCTSNLIADGIMLQGKQSVQQFHTRPPIV